MSRALADLNWSSFFEIVSWSVLACFYILDSSDVQKLFKVFEVELHIRNYQLEVRSLIEYQLEQVENRLRVLRLAQHGAIVRYKTNWQPIFSPR